MVTLTITIFFLKSAINYSMMIYAYEIPNFVCLTQKTFQVQSTFEPFVFSHSKVWKSNKQDKLYIKITF